MHMDTLLSVRCLIPVYVCMLCNFTFLAKRLYVVHYVLKESGSVMVKYWRDYDHFCDASPEWPTRCILLTERMLYLVLLHTTALRKLNNCICSLHWCYTYSHQTTHNKKLSTKATFTVRRIKHTKFYKQKIDIMALAIKEMNMTEKVYAIYYRILL